MSFSDVGRGGGSGGGGGGGRRRPLAGAAGAGGAAAGGAAGGAGFAGGAGGALGGGGGDMVTRRLSNLLMQHSQNVTILHRLVQSLGTMRDSAELRQQFHLQTEVVHELAGKIQGDLQAQAAELDNVSRQEAARRRATYTKLSKDFHRVNSIAAELETEAGRRSGEWDRKKEQEAATMQQQEAAMFGGGGMTGGGGQGQHQQQQMMINMQEEAVNQAIIEETEEELRNINRSLYKVNEVYRDLASIVSQQDEQVHHIEAKTEAAHERARQGLQQVQKANQSQSSCVLS